MGATGRAALAALAVLGSARIGVAPPERCPGVAVADVQASVDAAVGWLRDHQHADGTFAYLVDESGRDLGGYNTARHAGVLLSLEQAGADDVAAPARDWAFEHLVDAGDGMAFARPGEDPPTGASALLVRSLLERGSPGDDDVLLDLGRFLLGQVLPDGAVSARWSLADEAPDLDARDRFFTGETLWAFVGLAERFPDEAAFATAVDDVGAYVAVGDEAEDRFPPTSDHWAAYAYADLGDRMGDLQRAHAERLVGIVGVQVRVESTRWEGGLQRAVRGGPAVGSGLGTLGEAGGALLRALGDDADGLEPRMRCLAGMLVRRQVDGAWFTGGTTRMDDQQHAISALLAAVPLVADGAAAVGGGEQRHPWAWLVALGVLAAAVRVDPRRARRGLARQVRAAPWVAAALVLVALSGPVLDALDVSPASARLAAGVALLVAALSVLVGPAAAATTGVTTAAAGVLALAVGADDGARAVVAVLVAAVTAVAVPDRWRTPTVARALAVAALLLGVDLAVDGVLGV